MEQPSYLNTVMPVSGYTLEMLFTLQAAIASGTLSVYYGDKRVEYRSLNDMVRVENILKDRLGLAKPNSGRRYAVYGRGL